MAKRGKLKGKEQEIVQLYEAEESIITLALKFGVAPQSIYRVVKKYGKVRAISESEKIAHRQGRFKESNLKKRIFNYEEAIRLYKTGMSCQEIAEKLGVKSGSGTVWRCVNQAGIVRSMPEAHRVAREKGRWHSPFKNGKEHPDWKGGRRLSNGYVFIYNPDHPRASKRKKVVAEHILVWEQTHGKLLPDGWIVHHLNGIKNDNRPVNLVGLPGKKHSLVLQAKAKRIQELEALLRQQNQLL